MVQWFIRFPGVAKFTEFLFHLSKTPICTEASSVSGLNSKKKIIEGQDTCSDSTSFNIYKDMTD